MRGKQTACSQEALGSRARSYPNTCIKGAVIGPECYRLTHCPLYCPRTRLWREVKMQVITPSRVPEP